jgi:hypothetical protein
VGPTVHPLLHRMILSSPPGSGRRLIADLYSSDGASMNQSNIDDVSHKPETGW